MSTNNEKPHSAEFFVESRDFWWNADFLQLMARRLKLEQAKKVLDLGCGVGHWGQILAPYLAPQFEMIGIDREEVWVTRATQRAMAQGLGAQIKYQQGDVTVLPFADACFDLVTCQTVLIHLNDPKAALAEMLRVLKPGGVLLAVEPCNFANVAIASSLTQKLSVDEVMERLKFYLFIERGKQALGLGSNSAGDLIPGYLAQLPAKNIKVYVSDKAVPLFFPYLNKEQQVYVDQIKEWFKRKFIGWDRDEASRYFVAGGGRADQFDYFFNLALKDAEATVAAINDGSYHSAGGGVSYVISAQKPL